MRSVNKGVEPHELAEYRTRPNAEYDGPDFTRVKGRLRESLLEEQGHLCAYCMQRISAETMKVEHWHCQARYPGEQLRYQNLLACCKGNEGKPFCEQHCDTRKGDDDILYNPANPEHHNRLRIRVEGNGTIRSDDTAFNGQINSILNLNYSRLQRNRKKVVESVKKGLNRNSEERSNTEVQRLIVKWNTPNTDGRLREYCDVATYYLQKRLRRGVSR